jgi:hypothetical protein
MQKKLEKNLFVSLALGALFLTSCDTTSKTAKTPTRTPTKPPVISYDPQPPTTKVDTVKWTDNSKPPKKTNQSTTPSAPVVVGTAKVEGSHKSYKPGLVEKRERYNVVILMPFDAPSFKSVRSAPNLQAMAVEFYAGALIALYDLKSENMKLDVHVIDTKKYIMEELLTQSVMKNADIIFGPLQNEDTRKVADFADKNQIALISPFNPNSVVQFYPVSNYIQVSPTVETHFETSISYFKKKFANAEFAVIKGSSEAEGQNVEKVKNAYKRVLEDENAEIKVINADEVESWKTKIGVTKQAVLLMPSLRKEFIQNYLPRINGNAIVVGMQGWSDYDWIGSYCTGKSVYLTRDHVVDKSEEFTKDFKKRYWETYGFMPTHHAYRAYDIMLYFGRCLDEHGIYFKDHLENSSLSKKYMTTSFSLGPLHRAVQQPHKNCAEVRQYENRFLHLVKWDGVSFAKMNAE